MWTSGSSSGACNWSVHRHRVSCLTQLEIDVFTVLSNLSLFLRHPTHGLNPFPSELDWAKTPCFALGLSYDEQKSASFQDHIYIPSFHDLKSLLVSVNSWLSYVVFMLLSPCTYYSSSCLPHPHILPPHLPMGVMWCVWLWWVMTRELQSITSLQESWVTWLNYLHETEIRGSLCYILALSLPCGLSRHGTGSGKLWSTQGHNIHLTTDTGVSTGKSETAGYAQWPDHHDYERPVSLAGLGSPKVH